MASIGGLVPIPYQTLYNTTKYAVVGLSAWFAAHALTTVQTFWILVGSKPEWQRSIRAIVRQNQAYLRSGLCTCEDFAPEFVAHLRSTVPGLRCAPSIAPPRPESDPASWRKGL